MITNVVATPTIGTVNSVVVISWQLGYDVPWEPTTNDEVRLLTTSGVLVSRISMREAVPTSPAGVRRSPITSSVEAKNSAVGEKSLRNAECTMITPPFGGSFVVAFIDCSNNFRRVYTVPFRVVGPDYLPSRTLSFNIITAREEQRQLSKVDLKELPTAAALPIGAKAIKKDIFGNAMEEISRTETEIAAAAAARKEEPRMQCADECGSDRSASPSPSEDNSPPSSARFSVPPYQRLLVRFDANVVDSEVLRASSDTQVPMDCSENATLARLDEARNSSYRFVICREQHGDNLGFSDSGIGPYDHCAAVARVPAAAFLPLADGQTVAPDGPRYMTVELVAPSVEGVYSVRLMKTPLTSVPFSVASSDPFRVVLPLHPRTSRGELYGTMTANRNRCVAGEPLTVEYHITSPSVHLLSQFDTVVFFPYGRPESAAHGESMHESVMETVGRKVLSLRAPAESGCYDVALYSFLEQQPVIFLPQPIVVLPARIAIELLPDVTRSIARPCDDGETHSISSRLTLNGKTVWTTNTYCAAFRIEVTESLFHPRDRLVMLDEMSNVVHQIHLDPSADVTTRRDNSDSEYEGVTLKFLTAEVHVHYPIPGKYSMHYYSFVNQRYMLQAPLYLELLGSNRHSANFQYLPIGSISVLGGIPDDEKIEVLFKREGADSRPQWLREQDAVCLYVKGAPEAKATPFLDDTGCMPHLAVRYLRGKANDSFYFPSIEELRAQVGKSFAFAGAKEESPQRSSPQRAGNHTRHFSTSASQSNTSVTDLSTQQQHNSRVIVPTGSASSAISALGKDRHRSSIFNLETMSMLLNECTFVVRYMIALDGHYLRVCVSEATIKVLPRKDFPLGFHVAPLRHVAVRELAQNHHRITTAMTEDGRYSSLVSPSAMSRRSATTPMNTPDVRTHGGSKQFQTTVRVLNEGHNFAGAVLAPLSGLTTEPIVISFHITSGLPRGGDKILLFGLGAAISVSECRVDLATEARADFTLGTVVLNPPALEGTYVAGYHSDRHEGVVVVSEPFRVVTPEEKLAAMISGNTTGAKKKKPRVITPSTGRSESSIVKPPQASVSLTDISIASDSRMKAQRLPRCKVLVVAVSYLQQPHELKGPLNDAEAFSSIAKRFFVGIDANLKYPQTGSLANIDLHTDSLIRVLSEAKSDPHCRPTADNILRGLQWLRDDAQAGDQLVFYFSGAGSTMPDGSPCLLPVDFDWAMRNITPSVLQQHLLDAVPREVAVNVLIDSCYVTNRLEAFRRGELRSLSAGDEVRHLGWNSLLRRRKQCGVGTAPWRCVPPPRGTQVEDFGAAASKRVLPRPYGTLLMEPHSSFQTCSGNKPNVIVYEASRGWHGEADGAWDVFLRESSVTKGLFTHYLCAILERELLPEDPQAVPAAVQGAGAVIEPRGGIRWFELHETMHRMMESMSYRQHPRLWVGSYDALTQYVRSTTGTSTAIQE